MGGLVCLSDESYTTPAYPSGPKVASAGRLGDMAGRFGRGQSESGRASARANGRMSDRVHHASESAMSKAVDHVNVSARNGRADHANKIARSDHADHVNKIARRGDSGLCRGVHVVSGGDDRSNSTDDVRTDTEAGRRNTIEKHVVDSDILGEYWVGSSTHDHGWKNYHAVGNFAGRVDDLCCLSVGADDWRLTPN